MTIVKLVASAAFFYLPKYPRWCFNFLAAYIDATFQWRGAETSGFQVTSCYQTNLHQHPHLHDRIHWYTFVISILLKLKVDRKVKTKVKVKLKLKLKLKVKLKVKRWPPPGNETEIDLGTPSGHPVPTVTWTFNGEGLQLGDRLILIIHSFSYCMSIGTRVSYLGAIFSV